ncbi:MAG: hypothetical protein WCC11_02545 [Gammaproteobacteria bacterium]
MRSTTVWVFGLVCVLSWAAALAAPSAIAQVDVRDLITVTQFQQTGLNTLSPDQLKALNTWLTQELGSREATMPSTASLDVRNLISVTEFHQTGLDTLSPDELKAFNAWLTQYLNSRATTPQVAAARTPVPAAPVVAPAAAANFGADTMPTKEAATPSRIETRIAGMFTGWTGDTIFKLENGQVWQQIATGYFTNVELDHPQVIIKKLAFGYLLTLPGQGETVFVRRIK